MQQPFRDTVAALREREEFVRLLLDSTAEAIFGIDLSGSCTFCNAAGLRMLGYQDPAELMGKNLHSTFHHSHQSGRPYPYLECPVMDAVRRGDRIHLTNEVMWKKDGTCFPVEYWSYPIRLDEKLIGAVLTFIDISERRRLEVQLHQAQKMDAIGTLAGGVAHDFNNLLMVIGAYAELMLDSVDSENPLRHNVNEIVTATRRAAELTRQLLAFSRKQMQALQVLDLNSVIREVGKMLRRLIGEDVQLLTALDEDLERVRADAGQIEQIIMNLAANARDAMPEGGKLTIETRNVTLDRAYHQNHLVVPPGDYVLLSVSDTGEGIGPEHVHHIFEPFYTTKSDGKGTGLGLATVYGIVKQSGGFIWVYSEPGLGTTFKIYLPMIHERAREEKAMVQECNTRGTETVLLVEDEEAVRSSAREYLVLNGYTVIEATDGEEALKLSREFAGPIDLVVTDVVMPKMGGAQLVARVEMERPFTKVLCVSGYAESTVLRHGLVDAQRFLQKPFSLKALAQKIRTILDIEKASAAEAG
jgi:PAS domain S-box-containing protein